MMKQLEQVKALGVVNQILEFREIIKPVLKYFSGYLLTIVALGILEP